MMKQSKRSKRRNRHKYITDNEIINWWKQGVLIIDDPVKFRTEEEEKEYRDKLNSWSQAIDWFESISHYFISYARTHI